MPGFDESYEHEAWNQGSATRILLLVDMGHPDLTDVEVSLLEQVDAVMSGKLTLDTEVKNTQYGLDGKTWWV